MLLAPPAAPFENGTPLVGTIGDFSEDLTATNETLSASEA